MALNDRTQNCQFMGIKIYGHVTPLCPDPGLLQRPQYYLNRSMARQN